ncbi:MAG: ABC transporter ATP-binding protein [Xanthomonadales bacterium]|nr:ABC transporter ATP-binding protein [Xanthomonadales bacterium]
MSPTAPILEARELSVRHALNNSNSHSPRDLEAVHKLSLSVQDGEILAIVGESGSGKSSLARALVGLLPAAGGSIYYRGKAVSTLDSNARNSWRREVQLIFQDAHSALSPRRRIQQCLEEPLTLQAIPSGHEARLRIEAALADVNLGTDLLQRYPHQLSGGQKQRVALARALLSQPALIIADEPMAALDVSEQARLLNLMIRLRAEKNITFLLIAHDLAVVQQLADRIGVMYLGRLLELAPAQSFFQAAAHPYSQALLAASQRSWSCSTENGPVFPGDTPSALTPTTGCVFHRRCDQALKHCSNKVPEQQFLAQAGSGGEPHQVLCHLYSEAHKR